LVSICASSLSSTEKSHFHFVTSLPPLVLLMHRLCLAMHLLSLFPPGCLLFTGWLSCCISLHCLHLAPLFVAQLPHVSILEPLPSFAPARCCIASCRAASASRPLVNTATSQCAAALRCAGNSTSCLPLVHLTWLPHS
jgi:hypothetical protein